VSVSETRLAVVNCNAILTLAGPARPRIGKELGALSIVPDGAMLVREGRVEWLDDGAN
jgi:imidazolonepropionase